VVVTDAIGKAPCASGTGGQSKGDAVKRARRNAERRLCASCGARTALYRYHGHVKRDRTHVLCFQCYRAVRDSQRLAHPERFPLGSKPAASALTATAQAVPPRDRTGTND
jgi:hypothetical protein